MKFTQKQIQKFIARGKRASFDKRYAKRLDKKAKKFYKKRHGFL